MVATGIITFDGKAIFGHGSHHLEAGSWRRERVDRGFCGLDGILSLDLGCRERRLIQRGELSSTSSGAIQAMAANISNYLDGSVYELTDGYGETYSNVRMDSFELTKPMCTGLPARCEYKIQYTQLNI